MQKLPNLVIRILSGVALIALASLLFYLGPVYIVNTLILICIVGLCEWTALFGNSRSQLRHAYWIYLVGVIYISAGFWGIASILSIQCNTYIASLFPCCPVFFNEQTASHFLRCIICAISATDTGAYLIGSLWGKDPLCPKISPKKTWVGFFGGIFLGAISGVFLMHWFFGTASVNLWIIRSSFFAALVTISQCGDLIESYGKRLLSVKDSSNLIPGHGGILDRFDGFIGVGVFLLILSWIF
jgi:phosphatidate cytidylyltransferase